MSRRARGTGVATALLDAAIAYARDQGATMLEAYPVELGDQRAPAANLYPGTLSMFERTGFRVVARRQWNRSAVHPIVRFELTPKRRGR